MQQEQDTINIALGVISYLRCFFSEESFTNRKVDGLDLKVLKNTVETTRMINWIQNLNRHKEKIYKVVMGIYALNKEEEKLIELYSIDVNGKFDFKGLCRNLQRMRLLKGRYVIRMKVFTTAFIEIDGFKRTNQVWDLEKLRTVEFDGIKVYAEDEAVETIEESIPEGEHKIDCSCTINSDEKEMIFCMKCSQWVHTACHGYFSTRDKRIKKDFQCFRCSGMQNKELRNCCIYRRLLSVLYNERIYASDSNYKEEEGVTRQEINSFIQKRLSISNGFTNELVKKLRRDGFIVISKNQVEVVKSRETKEKIKEYFNGRRMESLIAMNEIKCEINCS
ncbi:HORMA domain-containing protein 1 [Glugoides intestinalis]